MKKLSSIQSKLVMVAVATLTSTSAFSQTTVSVQSGGGTVTSFNFGTAGTQANPWIINESITSLAAPVVLALTNSQTDAVGPTSAVTGFTYGKWFTKTVTNNTGSVWSSFDLELQSVLGVPSTNGDGLSFAQGSNLPFTGAPFTILQRIEDPRDFLNFSGGVVGIGQSVTFSFAITDNVLHNTIYLSETPNRVVGNIPEPETYALMLAGLGLMAYVARRRNRA